MLKVQRVGGAAQREGKGSSPSAKTKEKSKKKQTNALLLCSQPAFAPRAVLPPLFLSPAPASSTAAPRGHWGLQGPMPPTPALPFPALICSARVPGTHWTHRSPRTASRSPCGAHRLVEVPASKHKADCGQWGSVLSPRRSTKAGAPRLLSV